MVTPKNGRFSLDFAILNTSWSNHDPLKDFVYLGTVAILAQGKQSG